MPYQEMSTSNSFLKIGIGVILLSFIVSTGLWWYLSPSTATKTTEEMRAELNDPEFNYEIACTEVCGKGHFSMKKNLVVLSPEEYREWYKEQESFLKRNPDYMSEVPTELKEVASDLLFFFLSLPCKFLIKISRYYQILKYKASDQNPGQHI